MSSKSVCIEEDGVVRRQDTASHVQYYEQYCAQNHSLITFHVSAEKALKLDSNEAWKSFDLDKTHFVNSY